MNILCLNTTDVIFFLPFFIKELIHVLFDLIKNKIRKYLKGNKTQNLVIIFIINFIYEEEIPVCVCVCVCVCVYVCVCVCVCVCVWYILAENYCCNRYGYF